MKFTKKIFLFILAAWILMLFIVLLGVKYVLIANYLKVEDATSTDAALRIKNAFHQQINNLGKAADLWGIWDDTYAYLKDRNKDFIEEALSIASMEGADLDLTIMFDTQGKLVFSRALNDKRTEIVGFPPQLENDLKPGGSLWKFIENPKDDTALQGSLLINNQIYLLGGHSIVTNAGTGPARGMIIVGKRFTEQDWKTITEITKMDASITTIPELKKSTELSAQYQNLMASDKPVHLVRINSETSNAYIVIKDLLNKPLAMITVHLPRDIYLAGMKSIEHFIWLFIGVGSLLTLLLYNMIRKIVIRPLEKINAEIVNVGETKNFLNTIPVEGNDELASLGREFNQMFKTIYEYDEKNKKYHLEITQKLNESDKLRNQLQNAESFLSDIIDSMPSALIVLNKEMQIVQMNNKARKECINPSEKVNFFEAFPFMKPHEDEIKAVLSSNQPKTLNKIVEHKNDQSRFYNAIIFPVSQENISLRIDDITEYVSLQDQVLRNDKLASIGMLTAGVVNEINEPISECYHLIDPLKEHCEKLISLVKDSTKFTPDSDIDKNLQNLQDLLKGADVKAIIKKIVELMDSLQSNAAEVAGTVKILQNFARLDEDIIKKTDINAGIDSTLTLLVHRYKNRIDIVKNYGELPEIDSYPGRLNQVFMSVISTAMSAIEEKGELAISTELLDSEYVRMVFKDSGSEISSEYIEKIFDFNTSEKDVTNNAQTGLFVTKGIVEELKGTIEVKGTTDKGMKIIITLPIHH